VERGERNLTFWKEAGERKKKKPFREEVLKKSKDMRKRSFRLKKGVDRSETLAHGEPEAL